MSIIYLFTGVLFDFQQVDFQTLFHLTGLLLSCCLLSTQPGDLQQRRQETGERGGEKEDDRKIFARGRQKEIQHTKMIVCVCVHLICAVHLQLWVQSVVER